jgi:prepilin-type processing-associated H-X9-DG protein
MLDANDARKKPTDVKVQVTSGGGVDIVWADGHTSHYEFQYLREMCPCATCSEERHKKENAASQSAAAAPSGPSLGTGLPIYKPKPRARAAKTVGHYALQIDFTDGHSAGIYSYDYLRTICPCLECAMTFRAEI